MTSYFKRAGLSLTLLSLPITSYADLTPLNDEFLGDTVGQSGISIELETKVNIGEFRYTDEGSIALDNVQFGGANKNTFFGRTISSINPTDKLDDMRIDIDSNSNGDLLINMGATSTCIGCVGTSPVDFGLSFDSVRLVSQDNQVSTTIIQDFSMTGYFTAAYMQIKNTGNTGQINAKISFAIDDIDMSIPTLGMSIEDMYIAGSGFHEDQELGFFDIANSGAVARLTIEAVDGYSTGATTSDDVLSISLYGNGGENTPFEADMGFGNINIGNASIGSVTIDDLKLHGTKLHVFGH
ncbi:DUF6160 family protein [Litoribrevibacter euphylliae]|uniref:DUF6160 family protein n=1 Tax=Litoribrevibacter euphylliae TaxID=1834034 RepID=A0ABV7H6S4_9GAMM